MRAELHSSASKGHPHWQHPRKTTSNDVYILYWRPVTAAETPYTGSCWFWILNEFYKLELSYSAVGPAQAAVNSFTILCSLGYDIGSRFLQLITIFNHWLIDILSWLLFNCAHYFALFWVHDDAKRFICVSNMYRTSSRQRPITNVSNHLLKLSRSKFHLEVRGHDPPPLHIVICIKHQCMCPFYLLTWFISWLGTNCALWKGQIQELCKKLMILCAWTHDDYSRR